MAVRFVYLLVIFIWSTTPLAIKLGGSSLAPMANLSLRILIAFAVGSALCTMLGYPGLNIRKNWTLYIVGSIGLFPNMALVYFAAEYISSGLIALMFGLTPFFTALLSMPILGEKVLIPQKIIAILIALIGLVFIFFDDAVIVGEAYIGLLLMLFSNLIFSATVLWLKKINSRLNVSPFEQTLGAMAFSLPGLLITWFFIVGYESLVFTPVSMGALLYLSLIGSLVGFAAYYHILNHMRVETVALIPLITPVSGMALGLVVVGEVITLSMYIGACLILFALAIHQNMFVRVINRTIYLLVKKQNNVKKLP